MRKPEDSTPYCEVCGSQIEFLTDAVVLLKGQFFWMPEEQYAPLVLEPGTDFEVVQLETTRSRPQKALVVNPEAMGEVTVTHRECLMEAFELALASDDDDDDDDEENTLDLDHLDAEMRRAMAADQSEFIEDDHYFNRR